MLKFPSIMHARRFFPLRVFFLLAALTGVAVAQENSVVAHGIWTHGNVVVVFASFDECPDHPYRRVQPLVSHDGGKSWNPSGPRFEGSDFEYILDTGKALWIAGEGYAEGPTHDPFLLLFGPDNDDWPQFEIYSGGAELKAIALEEKTGKFRAWVEHISIDADDSPPPIFLHQSLDGGQTWEQTRQVPRVPKSAPGFRFFEEIPRQSGSWRIIGDVETGTVIEHLQADGKWHRIPDLPPQPCTAEELD